MLSCRCTNTIQLKKGYDFEHFSINLLLFHPKCCNLIGYNTRYLFNDIQIVSTVRSLLVRECKQITMKT